MKRRVIASPLATPQRDRSAAQGLRHSVSVLTMVVTMSACQPANPGFDRVSWQASRPASQPSGNLRLAMAPALLQQHLHAGMARQAVHALLGAPDFEAAGRDVWDLGFAPMRMDMASLIVEYDGGGAVRTAKVQEN